MKKMNILWLLLVCLSLLSGSVLGEETSAPVQGKDYYVALTGNDEHPGTIDKPWGTLTYAAEKAGPGDTVFVREGIYETEQISLFKKGKPEAQITFQAYPGEKVILDGSKASGGNPDIFCIWEGEYYTIQDFEIRNATRIAVNVWGGKHTRVLNCVIHDSTWGALYTGNGATDLLFDHNIVYHNCRNNDREQFAGKGGWASAVSLCGENMSVTGNLIYENWGEGLGFYGRKQYAADNILHDNYSVNIYVNNIEDSTLERNFVYTTGNPAFFRELFTVRGPAFAIEFANEGAPPEPQLYNLTIRNNIFYGGIFTMFYWNGLNGGGIQNSRILHNTFVSAHPAVCFFEGKDVMHSVLMAGNIFYQKNPEGALVPAWAGYKPGGIQFERNCWYGGKYPEQFAGFGDIKEDPYLWAPGGVNAGDYGLKAFSPAIGAAGVLMPNHTDYYGRLRRGRHDLGACEYDLTPDTTPPTSPSGLKVITVSGTTVTLVWSPATDNVGISGYDVYLGTDWKMKVTDPSVTLGNLKPRTKYTVMVTAKDYENNQSPPVPVSFTTSR